MKSANRARDTAEDLLGLRPPEKVLLWQAADERRRICRLADARGGVQFQRLPVWTWFPSAAAFLGRNLSRLATSEPVWFVSGCYGWLGFQPALRGFS